MENITKVFSDLVKPYIDAKDQALMNNIQTNGAKNLYSLTMKHLMEDNSSGTWNGNTCTFRGITYTCNFNAAGFLESVTMNGTADANNPSALAVRSYGWIADMVGQSVIGVMETEAGSVGRARWSFAIRDKDEQTLFNSSYVYSDDGQRQATDVAVVPPNSHYIRSQIYIVKGTTVSNVTVKLMICLKSSYDLNPSWEPSSKTNQLLTKETTGLMDNQNVNGAVNMIVFPYHDTTRVTGGVTFTVNDDGPIATSGTSTTTINFYLAGNSQSEGLKLKAGSYKLSGNPGVADIPIQLYDYTSGSAVLIGEDTGDGLYFTLSTDSVVMLRIRMASGVNTDGYTFKPMIAVASYTGDYVPFAKSNKELTEDVEELSILVAEKIKKYAIPIGTHNLVITSRTNGNVLKLITSLGDLTIDISTNFRVLGKLIMNRPALSSGNVWTYSIDGKTITINTSNTVGGFILAKNDDLEITTSQTSTPQANTIDVLNLYELSNS